MKVKRESVEDYLARGGSITRLPPQEVPDNVYVIPVASAPPTHDLGTGELLFSEFKSKKAKRKKSDGPVKLKNIDVNSLPPELVAKLGNKVTF